MLSVFDTLQTLFCALYQIDHASSQEYTAMHTVSGNCSCFAADHICGHAIPAMPSPDTDKTLTDNCHEPLCLCCLPCLHLALILTQFCLTGHGTALRAAGRGCKGTSCNSMWSPVPPKQQCFAASFACSILSGCSLTNSCFLISLSVIWTCTKESLHCHALLQSLMKKSGTGTDPSKSVPSKLRRIMLQKLLISELHVSCARYTKAGHCLVAGRASCTAMHAQHLLNAASAGHSAASGHSAFFCAATFCK